MDASNLVEQAREAIQSGNQPLARQFLHQAVRQEPNNMAGWLWLASIAPSPKASLAYVKRAEQLAPNNPTVQKAKAWAERRLPSEPTSSMPPPSNELQSGWRRWAALASLAILLLVVGFASFWLWNSRGGETAVSPPTTALAEAKPIPGQAEPEPPLLDAAKQPDTVEQVALASIGETAIEAVPTTPEPTEEPIRILAKSAQEAAEPRAKWTATPLPTNTPVPTPTLAPTFVAQTTSWVGKRPYGVGENERWIDINLSSQTLSAFEGDTLIFSSVISSGTANHPTVTGQFRTWLKYESQTMDGRRLGYDYYLENVPYVMYFYQDYAIHGAYWHDNFGTPMSHGCVNMNIADSQWLFNWAGLGTLVNVHY